MSNGNIFEGRW